MKSIHKKIVALISCIFMLICSISTVLVFLIASGDVNWACNQGHPLANVFSYIYGVSNKIIGRKIYQDGESVVYVLKNGHLVHKTHDYDPTENKTALSDFKSYLTGLGIDFSYVITCDSGDERLNQLPFGAPKNHCGQVTNRLVGMLDDLDIDYIDVFKHMTNAPMDYYDYYYYTDHHWNDYGGLYVAEIISNFLNSKYNYNIDSTIFNINNYTEEVHEKLFLGSFGKKVGTGVVEREDFIILNPKFKTNFKVSATGSYPARSGTYRESLIYDEHLSNEYSWLEPYCAYVNGNQKMMSIENLEVQNGKRILVLKDSKANVVNAHLACAVQYLDIIDLRYYNGNLKAFIESTTPDMVMMIQAPFSTPIFYNFG